MNDAILTGSAQAGAQFEHATVTACTEAGYIIHGPLGVTTAQVAAGCLLEPGTGDRVLVSRCPGECFILGVLVRQGQGRRVRIDGELTISAGRLNLQGDEAVEVSGPRVGVVGQVAELRAGRADVAAEEGTARFQRTRLVTGVLETVSDRVVQCARQVVRRVEEVETLSVGNLIQRVRENLVSRSRRTSITARKDVHVDGERIHMG